MKNDNPNRTIAAYQAGVNDKGVKGCQWNLRTSKQTEITYTITIKDPKRLLSCLAVETAVNAALMHASKDPRDGMI